MKTQGEIEAAICEGLNRFEMADDNAAREAIAGLNEQEHDGRSLTVNEARPREERSYSRR